MTFSTLLATIKKNKLKVDAELLELAYGFAKEAHHGQIRLSGEPYITHSLVTANTLAGLRMDEPTILAGLLHDVPEDTPRTLNDIRENFGEEVAMLVE